MVSHCNFSLKFYSVLGYSQLTNNAVNVSGEEEMNSTIPMKKAHLKLIIQKTKIVASSSITSWQTDGENMVTVRDFTFLVSKITVDGDCSLAIKDTCSMEEKL